MLEVREVQEPGNYQDMSMNVGRKKTLVFHFLIDSVKQKLQVWGNKMLSKAGKATLLKTTTQMIPNFWMKLL